VSKLPNLDRAPLIAVLQQAFDGIALATGSPPRLAFVNPTLATWLGKPVDELVGEPLEGIFGAGREHWELINRTLRSSPVDTAMVVYLRNDADHVAPLEARASRVAFGDELLLALTLRKPPSAAHFVSPRSEQRDPLTELPDRAFLKTRLAALLQGNRAADRQFAVLFVDLDDFKQVNDEHGHITGDRVLRECSRRLAECVREGDHVTRFGGDEFVVLLEHVAEIEEIRPVIERIHLALATPISLPEGEFTPRVSIGVAMASPEHRSPEDLLHEADRAMYAAKRVRI
jgi:diguanylate cyclase (GGDEF)-like protein